MIHENRNILHHHIYSSTRIFMDSLLYNDVGGVGSMYEVIGLKTKKIYAVEERRNDCFRNLQSEYPYINGTGKGVPGKVYPEPLLIRRVNDEQLSQEV